MLQAVLKCFGPKDAAAVDFTLRLATILTTHRNYINNNTISCYLHPWTIYKKWTFNACVKPSHFYWKKWSRSSACKINSGRMDVDTVQKLSLFFLKRLRRWSQILVNIKSLSFIQFHTEDEKSTAGVQLLSLDTSNRDMITRKVPEKSKCLFPNRWLCPI